VEAGCFREKVGVGAKKKNLVFEQKNATATADDDDDDDDDAG